MRSSSGSLLPRRRSAEIPRIGGSDERNHPVHLRLRQVSDFSVPVTLRQGVPAGRAPSPP